MNTFMEKIRFSGLPEQQVELAAKETGYDFSGVDNTQAANGGLFGLRYDNFTVPLVKAVQEQQIVIEKLNNRIDKLEKALSELLQAKDLKIEAKLE